jgi:HlyD family secretion protein
MLYTYNQKLVPQSFDEDTIPPISQWTYLAGTFLVVTVGTIIILFSWMKYNVTVKVPAVVRPVGEIRVVQSEIESTVKYILVKENQHVNQGDVIANLDTQDLLIKQSLLKGNIQQVRLQLIQIDTQIRILEEQILAQKKVIIQVVAAARSELLRSLREYQEKKIISDAGYLESLTTIEQQAVNLNKAEADLAFAQVDKERFQLLSQTGAVGQRDFAEKKLAVEQSKLNLESARKALSIAKIKLKSAKAELNPTLAAVNIAQERIPQENAKGEADIAVLNKEREALIQRKVELHTQLSQYQKDLEQLNTQLNKSTIVATSTGTILKLDLRNPGQVVRVSQSIAEIAPDNAPLVIKSMIPTSEIKKVAMGEPVNLRFDACPYPDYGTLKGYIKTISPDAIAGQDKNPDTTTSHFSNTYYEVTIQPENLVFGNSQHRCFLQAGMDAHADIISQRETVLKFILRKARLISEF